MTDLHGGDYFSPVGDDIWRETEKGGSGGGGGGDAVRALIHLIGIVLIVFGIMLSGVWLPLGIITWLGIKLLAV